MSAIDVTGRWDLVIVTPIGAQNVVLDVAETADGLTGVATGTAESVPAFGLQVDGNHLRWRQRITRPMRLNLTFDVTVDADTMTGTSKAGLLPSSRVTGTRRRP